MLTTQEILTQYDRHNHSRVLDEPTQKLLASILDAFEARTKKK
jgi:hypothetical protein